MSNPGNIAKYSSNPKIMALITKLQEKMGGGPPMGSGGPNMGAAPNPPKTTYATPESPDID